jgi:hypothetical protein
MPYALRAGYIHPFIHLICFAASQARALASCSEASFASSGEPETQSLFVLITSHTRAWGCVLG